MKYAYAHRRASFAFQLTNLIFMNIDFIFCILAEKAVISKNIDLIK